jgi:hypothetical protein
MTTPPATATDRYPTTFPARATMVAEPSCIGRRAFRMPRLLTAIGILWVALSTSCTHSAAGPAATGEDAEVTSRGSIEVTAQLEEIPEGAIFRRDLYDYATVLKYRVLAVHRGEVAAETIYVAHYNPFRPRAEAADRRVPEVGGDLRTFRNGQVHRMALEVPIDDHYMGGIVNKYFEETPDPIYWAVWTNATSS